MITEIDQQIKEWKHQLLLASNPTEAAKVKAELKRLNTLKRNEEKEKSRKIKDEREQIQSLIPAITGTSIFVIHGHDEAMKHEVQLFVSRCGLDDVVGHEEADIGRTIIEKLEASASATGYALALLSPDDVLEDGTMRARQNVIFEIGYFMGKLGRKRVRLLRKPGTVIPTDLKGIIYTIYDDHGAWKLKVAKEMKAAGINVDMVTVADKF